MATAEKIRSDDWKDKYFKALNELDDHERARSQLLTRVNRDFILMLGNLRGQDASFDRDLDAIADDARLDDESRRDRLVALLPRVADLVPCNVTSRTDDRGPETSNLTALADLFDALITPPASMTRLAELRQVAIRAGDNVDHSSTIEHLAQQLSAIITDSGPVPSSESRDAIQSLLDHLSLPASAQTELAAITPQLQSAKDAAAVRRVAKQIANILVAFVDNLQAEISGLNNFLLLIKNRLDRVSEHVVDEKNDRDCAVRAREKLDQSVQHRLDEMREQVSGANSIDDLKEVIHEQISLLDNNVENYLSAESGRLTQRAHAHDNFAEQLQAMRKESETLRLELSRAQSQAIRDALTGLPNRAAYNERLETEFARMQRSDGALTLAVIDLDKFKSINDTWGHQAGDRVLKYVARELTKQIRQQDFFGRYGGEEFVLLLPGTKLEGATTVAENLRRHVDGCRFTYKNTPVAVTVSIGIAEFSPGDLPAVVFERADSALYLAKDRGRNRCECAA